MYTDTSMFLFGILNLKFQLIWTNSLFTGMGNLSLVSVELRMKNVLQTWDLVPRL